MGEKQFLCFSHIGREGGGGGGSKSPLMHVALSKLDSLAKRSVLITASIEDQLTVMCMIRGERLVPKGMYGKQIERTVRPAQ